VRQRVRTVAQRAALAVCALMVLAVADIYWSSGHEPRNLFRVVAGDSVLVSGDLVIPADKEGIRLHAEASAAAAALLPRYIEFMPDGKNLSLRFIELKGRLWRGELTVPDWAPAGEQGFAVRFAHQPPNEAPRYVVRVFDDEASLRADLPSVFMHRLGVRPWWVVLGGIPVALGFGFLVFREAGRDEERLVASGIGEIYRLAKRKEGWEVLFGLGASHGVKTGDTLMILDRAKRPVGRLTALEVKDETTVAQVPLGEDIRPDYFIMRLP